MIECCGVPLTQKRHQKMCKITTKLDDFDMTLSLSSIDDETAYVKVPLLEVSETARKNGIVCVKSVQTTECSTTASSWVTSFLGLPNCKLQRLQEDSHRSLSNDAPYLLVNEASISVLAGFVGLSLSEAISRFRPNIVVKGIPPFLEDTANCVKIEDYRFEVLLFMFTMLLS
ncbi:hypothetical protein COOONC_05002 [Cooperia oncophora]